MHENADEILMKRTVLPAHQDGVCFGKSLPPLATCPAKITAILLLALWLAPAPAQAAAGPNNILLIIADDYSTDGLQMFNPVTNGVTFPRMPTVERLARTGLTFRNAYSYPTCSPARCTMLTGRYGFRTGIGYALANPLGPTLSTNEFTLPEALSKADTNIQHALIGKWHLSFKDPDPNTIGGFSFFSGGILGELSAYDYWPAKISNGVEILNHWTRDIPPRHVYTNYATTDNLKDATNWISAQGSKPWFLWLAFNACHKPFHLPPPDLHSYTHLSGTDEDIATNSRPYYEAMAESLDTCMARLLDFLGPKTSNTTIIFMGDNGTPASVIQAPFTTNQCKGSLYEGGIRIPLIISGPAVTGTNRVTDALVSTVDLYATILEMAGVNLASTLPTNLVFDSQSLMPIITNALYEPVNRFILAENFDGKIPNSVAGRAIRNSRFKLLFFDNGTQEMYDLSLDPWEHTNLLSGRLDRLQQSNYTALVNKLADWPIGPAPVVTRYDRMTNRFAVTTTHSSDTPCWLLRNDAVDYPVWTVLTNVNVTSLSSTTTRIADTNLLHGTAFYRVSLHPVPNTTYDPTNNWRDLD
jgi:arylsulfatase A-like enzyme